MRKKRNSVSQHTLFSNVKRRKERPRKRRIPKQRRDWQAMFGDRIRQVVLNEEDWARWSKFGEMGENLTLHEENRKPVVPNGFTYEEWCRVFPEERSAEEHPVDLQVGLDQGWIVPIGPGMWDLRMGLNRQLWRKA